MIWDIAGIVLLTLLKILGIVLLLLLLLLLLVLLVPLRYQVCAGFGEEYEVRARFSWLWFLVRLPICWQDGQVRWKLQILGIPILDSTKSGNHTRRHNSKRNGSQRSKRKKAGKQSVPPEEKSEEDRQPETDAVLIKEDAQGNEQLEEENVLSEENAQGDEQMDEGEISSEGNTQGNEQLDEGEISSEGNTQGSKKLEEESALVPKDSEGAVDQRENTEKPSLNRYNQSEDVQNKKKHKRCSPCKRLWHKICELYRAVCNLIRNIRRKVHSVQDLNELLHKDSSRRFICIAKENMLQLWKHLKPQKIQGEIRFGTGDPCSTGQILGGIAVFYSWLGTGVHITPDFEEACFEGWIKGKGRIRMITMVIILIRLIRNKDFRKLQGEWRQWKEDF